MHITDLTFRYNDVNVMWITRSRGYECTRVDGPLARNLVSVLLFSVCLTVYLSRSRALARLAAEPAPARAGETPSPKGGREWIPRT